MYSVYFKEIKMNELAIRAQNVVLSLMSLNDLNNVDAALETIGINETNSTRIIIDSLKINDLKKINDFLHFKQDENGNYIFCILRQHIGDRWIASVVEFSVLDGILKFPSIFESYLPSNLPDISIEEIQKLPYMRIYSEENNIADFLGWNLKGFYDYLRLDKSWLNHHIQIDDHEFIINNAVIKYSVGKDTEHSMVFYEVFALSIYSYNKEINPPTEEIFEEIKLALKILHELNVPLANYSEELRVISTWHDLLLFLADKINFYSEIEKKRLETEIQKQRLVMEAARIEEGKRNLKEGNKTSLPFVPPMKDETYARAGKSNHGDTIAAAGILAGLVVLVLMILVSCSGA